MGYTRTSLSAASLRQCWTPPRLGSAGDGKGYHGRSARSKEELGRLPGCRGTDRVEHALAVWRTAGHRPTTTGTHTEHQGTQAVFADYWVANRLTFETDEHVIGVAIDPDLGIGPYQHRNRYHPYLEMAQAATRVAWILPLGSAEQPLQRLLVAHHARAHRVVWGPFAVYTNVEPPLRPPDLTTGGRI